MTAIKAIEHFDDTGALVVTWEGVSENDECEPVAHGAHGDRSIHVEGNFGVGGTVVVEGNNFTNNSKYAKTYRPLKDHSGTVISIIAAGLEAIAAATNKTRPRVSAGTGVNVHISLLIRR